MSLVWFLHRCVLQSHYNRLMGGTLPRGTHQVGDGTDTPELYLGPQFLGNFPWDDFGLKKGGKTCLFYLKLFSFYTGLKRFMRKSRLEEKFQILLVFALFVKHFVVTILLHPSGSPLSDRPPDICQILPPRYFAQKAIIYSTLSWTNTQKFAF